MESIPSGSVHAFINPAAGSAQAALAVLRDDPRVHLHELAPTRLKDAITHVVRGGATSIIVAGGDGTVSTAAGCVVDSPASLCILRSGTMNHFARRIGVPADPKEALELAFEGRTTKMDAGWVNERLFLNTSVVGLYVDFVRRRDRLKNQIGRVPASMVAAVRSFISLRDHHVELVIDGTRRTYKSVLFFAGVGERDFRVPVLGELKDAGRRGLHIVAVQPESKSGLMTTVLRLAARGVRAWPSGDHPDSFVVDTCRLDLNHPTVRVALDGEIVEMTIPLSYSFQGNAVAVRTPHEQAMSSPSA